MLKVIFGYIENLVLFIEFNDYGSSLSRIFPLHLISIH
jgi:hypothetical protein